MIAFGHNTLTNLDSTMEPFYPPVISRDAPSGREISFPDICSDAGIECFVTMNNWPEIRVHGHKEDFVVDDGSRKIYCIAASGLPINKRKRAVELLRKLAFQFHDWAAHETLDGYRRHQNSRIAERLERFRNLLTDDTIRVLSFIRRCEFVTSAQEISDFARLPLEVVDKTLETLASTGLLIRYHYGNERFFGLSPEAKAIVRLLEAIDEREDVSVELPMRP